MRTRASLVVQGALLLCALFAFGACGGGQEQHPQTQESSNSAPSMPSSAASTTTSPQSPGGDLPADEEAAYEASAQRWSDYEAATASVWERGEVTREARELFQSFFVSPVWQQYVNRLQTYQDAQVTITGLPTVLYSEARRITLSGGGGSVVIRQCVDYSSQVFRQAGEVVERYPFPVRRTATLDRADGSAEWLLLRIDEPAGDQFERCEVPQS